MKVSDELREWASHAMVNKNADVRELSTIADRIDAETVELPKDRDGVPIHVGDTVYGCRSGMKMAISELRMKTNGWSISTIRGYLTDAAVTHTRPDSFERIADELEAWCDDTDVDGDACGKPRELAVRIRKMAKRDD